MTRDDIREIARVADIDWHRNWNDDGTNKLEVFAALVADTAATEEREACEAIVKKELRGGLEGRPRLGFGCYMIEAIRARGSK